MYEAQSHILQGKIYNRNKAQYKLQMLCTAGKKSIPRPYNTKIKNQAKY